MSLGIEEAWLHKIIPDLYYGGETLALEQPQAFTCPFCNRMGFTDTTLMEHVTADHADTTLAVSYRFDLEISLCQLHISICWK